MAQRAKYQWRGRTYTRKSKRPGKQTVRVQSYCRRGATSFAKRMESKAMQEKEWGF
jgi:hypothetical protein